MSKRAKSAAKSTVAITQPLPSETPTSAPHAPRKQPMLLAISVLFFAAWFVFLLVVALTG